MPTTGTSDGDGVFMKRIMTWQLLLLFCLSLFLGGCNGKQAQKDQEATGYKITDSQGYSMTMPKKPQRIVSVSLASDEILVDLVAADRIAALTYLADNSGISNVTEQAKQIPRRIKDNAESIIALQPDLVFMADWQSPDLIQAIRDAGISVYVYKAPGTIDEVKQVIEAISQAVGEEAVGKQLTLQMDGELDKITQKLQNVPADKHKTVLMYTLMGGTGGVGSTFDDIRRYASLKNAASIVGLGRSDILSKEQIVQANPDMFFMPTWDYTGKTDIQQFKENVQQDAALQTVKAVREHHLFTVSDRHLNCTSQYIVEGVKDIASAAYPDCFE
jgi:iron complex transport system substrate-binding protein